MSWLVFDWYLNFSLLWSQLIFFFHLFRNKRNHVTFVVQLNLRVSVCLFAKQKRKLWENWLSTCFAVFMPINVRNWYANNIQFILEHFFTINQLWHWSSFHSFQPNVCLFVYLSLQLSFEIRDSKSWVILNIQLQNSIISMKVSNSIAFV